MNKNNPKHVAIILDGNRRYAAKCKMAPWIGHKQGAEKVREMLDWCLDSNVEELTLYVMSIDNFERSKAEVNFLMSLFNDEFASLLSDESLEEKGVRINFIGRLDMFSEKLQNTMDTLMSKTAANCILTVNLAMGYSGRAEIIDAVKDIVSEARGGCLEYWDVDKKMFSGHLYLKSEPDLIIRTSESRLSGFLPWQGVYSEIIFLPKILWPEFSKRDFTKCLKEYSNRKRRFGK